MAGAVCRHGRQFDCRERALTCLCAIWVVVIYGVYQGLPSDQRLPLGPVFDSAMVRLLSSKTTVLAL